MVESQDGVERDDVYRIGLALRQENSERLVSSIFRNPPPFKIYLIIVASTHRYRSLHDRIARFIGPIDQDLVFYGHKSDGVFSAVATTDMGLKPINHQSRPGH